MSFVKEAVALGHKLIEEKKQKELEDARVLQAKTLNEIKELTIYWRAWIKSDLPALITDAVVKKHLIVSKYVKNYVEAESLCIAVRETECTASMRSYCSSNVDGYDVGEPSYWVEISWPSF